MSGCLTLFGEAIFQSKLQEIEKLHFGKQRFSHLFYEEFQLDLHGSGNFYFLLIDLNGVCIKIIKLAPNVLKSYLLLFIRKLILFALTTNAIIIFIVYLYMYLLTSLYLLEFIVVSTFIQLEYIYNILNGISTVFIALVSICNLYVFYIIYWVGSNFLLFNTCAIKFIVGKFYFEGRACYIGKIMPTCIE